MKLLGEVPVTFSDVVTYTREKDRVRLFPGFYEPFCLIIPAIFLVILGADWWYFKVLTGSPTEVQINRFITSLFFFNSIHIYFTFIYLLTVPEFKEWISSSTDGRPWRFWLEVAFVMVISGILVAIAFFNVPVESYTFPILTTIVILILPYHHQIKQAFGLSMLYNAEVAKRYRLTEEESQRARTCALYERWAFMVFMTFFFASFFTFAVGTAFELESMTLRYFNRFLYAVTGLSVLFIIVNALYYPYALKSNKLLFLLRLIFYPMLPYAIGVADPALRACHGTEYICVNGAISKNSEMTPDKKKQYILISALVLFLGIVFLLCRSNDGLVSFLYEGGYGEVPAVLKVLAFSSLALTYTHIYLDRRLFQFRNPENRKHLLPLLHS